MLDLHRDLVQHLHQPATGSTTYSWDASGQRAHPVATAATQTYGWNQAMGTLTCVNTSGTSCYVQPHLDNHRQHLQQRRPPTSSALGGGTAANFTWDTTTQIPRDLSDGTWDYVTSQGPTSRWNRSGHRGPAPRPTYCSLIPIATPGDRSAHLGHPPEAAGQLHRLRRLREPHTQSGGSAETGGLTATHTGINSNYVATTPFGFGGGYTDAASGLIYLVNRWFDPATAQFMSIDPALSQTQQPYEYAGDNPVNQVDPVDSMCTTTFSVKVPPA